MKHWLLQRGTALLLLCSLVLTFYTQNIAWLFLGLIILVFHIEQGVDSMLMDYVQSTPVRNLASLAIFLLLILTCAFWFLVLL